MRQRNVGKQPHHGTYIRAYPCDCGKRGYKTRKDAKNVVKEMRRNGDPAPTKLQTYICGTDPDYWHVGHGENRNPNLNDPNAYIEETTQ